ncbi:MAG: 3-keto-disaccharide hydrolase [Planctomycetota bacterium]
MMKRHAIGTLFVLMTLGTVLAKAPVYTDPEQPGDDFEIQGEYVGTAETKDGARRVGVQVIARGNGKFDAVAYPGGLPGAGYNGEETRAADGQFQLDNGKAVFRGDDATATIAEGVLSVDGAEGETVAKLKKVMRESPTLGKEPPREAVVLFDGTDADAFRNGEVTDDGLLKAGVTSKRTFGDHSLHVEFRLPYQPEDRGQGRGNSGIYLQGRYEIQMLDSFGLEGKHNECGGIYERKAPDVNMCYPPLSWQTYDIDFTAAKYDDQGDLLAAPKLTVRHNGEVIHDGVELPNDQPTRAAPVKAGPTPGPVYLQDHGNPVRYRNIWVVEK